MLLLTDVKIAIRDGDGMVGTPEKEEDSNEDTERMRRGLKVTRSVSNLADCYVNIGYNL